MHKTYFMLTNPFVIAGKIPDEYFCDRVEETDQLINYLTNHNNVVLTSPRRMGKSGLILHCFDRKEIRENFKTLYIDIYQTTSLKEFVLLFGRAVFDNLVPKSLSRVKLFMQILKSLKGKFSVDPITGLPSFNILLGDILYPDITLQEIFTYIEKYEKRCIIAFDEFQQITKYPEKNIEALLRTHISQGTNANYIFAGSERHMITEMFFAYNRPFYNSTTPMTLEAIPKDIYCRFASRQFQLYEKELSNEAIEKIYDHFEGITFYLQRILNQAFADCRLKERCDYDFLKKTIKKILEANSSIYRELLSMVGEQQKELLLAIADSGKITGITSSKFIKQYNLKSASSVQAASKQLLEKDFITKMEKTYTLSDKFMALWIRQTYGPGNDILL